MNINELYFFKTILCVKKEKHDFDICYFCHPVNTDLRRLLIDFREFFKIASNLEDDETEIINKAHLKYYTNMIGFENDVLNKIIYAHIPCKNAYEHKYHILNYKENECFFEKEEIICPYGALCHGIHKKISKIEKKIDSRDEIAQVIFEDSDIDLFKNIFNKLLDPKQNLAKSQIINFYKKLSKCNNRFAETKNFLLDLDILIKKKILKQDKLFINLNLQSERSIKNLDEFLRISPRNSETAFKKNIFEELKNIPIIVKDELYYNIIKIDNQLVFLERNIPKKEDVNKLLIAMLNSHNGIIIYGVDVNTSKVKGLKMDRKARDLFRQTLNSEYKNYFIEYEGCIKYKFYDLDDSSEVGNSCLLVIKIKKINDHKILFDPYKKCFIIKDKFIRRYYLNNQEKVKLTDIKQLNQKDYVNITRHKLIAYYKNKFNL